MELKKGGTYYYVPKDSRWYKPREVTVTKAGRKWAHLDYDRHKADVKTGAVECTGFGSTGQLYPNKAAYEAELYRENVYSALRKAQVNPNVPTEDLTEVLRLLRLPVEVPGSFKMVPREIVSRLVFIVNHQGNPFLVASALDKIRHGDPDAAISDLSLFATEQEEDGDQQALVDEVEEIIAEIENLPV